MTKMLEGLKRAVGIIAEPRGFDEPQEDVRYRTERFPGYKEALQSGAAEEEITYALKRDLGRYGLNVVPRSRGYLNERHGDSLYANPVGYRQGDLIEIASDLDPVAERAVLMHEAHEGTGTREDEKRIFKSVVDEFERNGDISALWATLRIGNPDIWVKR